jgi:L,D-peptidoglycan transpeptidase YkuD (ErfK/YbiS/YcfS/YnhG family)
MLRAARSRHTLPLALMGLLTVAGATITRAAGQPVVPVDHAATASARAVSLGAVQVGPLPALPPVDSPALAGCDAAVLQRLVASDTSVSQWVVVSTPTSSSTSGVLWLATVRGTAWVCTLPATAAEVGRQGVRPLLQRRSGDDTTPAGVFPLGTVVTPQGAVSFFGNSADPGVHGAYRRVQPGDCYGANPNTPGYGHWRVDASGCTGDDELLERNVEAYEHAALIGANTEPMVSGDAAGEIAYAAAIFLHRTTYAGTGAPKPTSGCVSISHAALLTALRAIDPTLRPRFAIDTQEDLLATPAGTVPLRG